MHRVINKTEVPTIDVGRKIENLDLERDRKYISQSGAFFALYPGSRFDKESGEYKKTWDYPGTIFISKRGSKLFMDPFDILEFLEFLREDDNLDFLIRQIQIQRDSLEKDLERKKILLDKVKGEE